MRRRPSPWHASQRPPFTLKLNRARPVAPLARFRQHRVKLANGRKNTRVRCGIRTWRASDRRLIDLNHLINVLDADDRAICFRAAPSSGKASAPAPGTRMSFTSVDFPEPETPVTTVSSPRGIGTSMFFRLLACAPRIEMALPFGTRRFQGTAILTAPERYWPVSESGFAAISAGGPAATSCPPALPAPGPRSTT